MTFLSLSRRSDLAHLVGGVALLGGGGVMLAASGHEIFSTLALALAPWSTALAVAASLGCIAGGYATIRQAQANILQRRAAAEHIEQLNERRLARRPEAAFSQIGVEAITLYLGRRIAEELCLDNSEQTLDRLNDMRREVARDTGIVLPSISVQDDFRLADYEYVVFVQQRKVANYTVRGDKALAIGAERIMAQLPGEDVREPVYDLKAKWIALDQADAARAAGAMVFDNLSVIVSHIGQIARDNLADIFGRQEFMALIDHMRTVKPALVNAICDITDLSVVYKTYRSLLAEQAWPRDPATVFETILCELEKHRPYREWMLHANSWDRKPEDYAKILEVAENPIHLAEAARKKIVPALLQNKTELSYISVAEGLRKRILTAWSSPLLSFADIVLGSNARTQLITGHKCIIAKPAERRILSEFFAYTGIKVQVFSTDELPQGLTTKEFGVLDEQDVLARSTFALPAFPL